MVRAAAAQMTTTRRRDLQTLSAGITHELRNPINAATLQLEVLARRIQRAGLDDSLLEPLDLARYELSRVGVLLDDLVVFADVPNPRFGDHDLVEVVIAGVELERASAARKRVDLAIAAQVDLGTMRVDRAKLCRAVQHLVRNAVEAVAEGGHVTVHVIGEPHACRIVIEDDGPGMDAETRSRIFEPFFSTKDMGTGLGMSIVKSIVELHHGTVEVTSSSSGTRCEVALPREPANVG